MHPLPLLQVALLIIPLAAAAAAAQGQDAPGDPPDLAAFVKQYDTDRDRALSAKEIAAVPDGVFKSIVLYYLDPDKDGVATAKEVAAAIAEQRRRRQ